MARKTNPILIRLNTVRTWLSLWHSDHNYMLLNNEDLFIRKYIKSQLRLYNLDALKIFIKRTISQIFITVDLYNYNYKIAKSFKSRPYQKTDHFIEAVLSAETPRFKIAIYKLTGVPKIHLCFKFIENEVSSLNQIILTSNPILLSYYFLRNYIRMDSQKRLFKKLKEEFSTRNTENNPLKGIQIKVSGPIKAPRVRRSQTIIKYFLGSTPLQTFNDYIDYVVKSRSLSEGLVTTRFWYFKQVLNRILLKKKNLTIFLENLIKLFNKDTKKMFKKHPIKKGSGDHKYFKKYTRLLKQRVSKLFTNCFKNVTKKIFGAMWYHARLWDAYRLKNGTFFWRINSPWVPHELKMYKNIQFDTFIPFGLTKQEITPEFEIKPVKDIRHGVYAVIPRDYSKLVKPNGEFISTFRSHKYKFLGYKGPDLKNKHYPNSNRSSYNRYNRNNNRSSYNRYNRNSNRSSYNRYNRNSNDFKT